MTIRENDYEGLFVKKAAVCARDSYQISHLQYGLEWTEKDIFRSKAPTNLTLHFVEIDF